MTVEQADACGIGSGEAPGVAQLVAALAAIDRPNIIEVGTLRWEADRPTHHEAWAPHGAWLKVDATAGPDVDVVADAHTLHTIRPVWVHVPPEVPADGLFDAYVACSVWEHLERPWRAMEAAAASVRPGGLVYVQTHQTFPIHGYPSDFYRFSDKALCVQAEDAGLSVVHAGYLYPATIGPPPEVTRWNPAAPAWLNVELLAQRPFRSG